MWSQLSAGASPAVLHGLSHASPEQLAEALRYTEAAKVLNQHMAALKAESEKAAVKEPASEGKVCPFNNEILQVLCSAVQEVLVWLLCSDDKAFLLLGLVQSLESVPLLLT
jgi:hypothetical protein